MKIPHKIISLLAGTALFAASSLSAVTTDPVGYVTIDINGSIDGIAPAFTQLSAPLQNSVLTTGALTETPSSSVITNASASMTVNGYSTTDSVDNYEYYIQFTSGNSAGQILNVIANSETTITTNADLTGRAEIGDTYIIKKHTTIGDIFGVENTAGLKSGGNSTASDLVYVMSSDGNGSYANYYYQTDSLGFLGGTGWRAFGDNATDVSDVIIGPDDGIIVSRTGVGDLTLTISGSVNMVQHLRGLPNGYSLVSYPFPVDVTLDASGIYTPTNGYVSGGNSTSSDLVYVLNSDGSFDVYYRQTDTLGFLGGDGWRAFGDTNTDVGSTLIPAGASIIVYHTGNGLEWASARPY